MLCVLFLGGKKLIVLPTKYKYGATESGTRYEKTLLTITRLPPDECFHLQTSNVTRCEVSRDYTHSKSPNEVFRSTFAVATSTSASTNSEFGERWSQPSPLPVYAESHWATLCSHRSVKEA